jgi:hypothetical protein
MAGIWPVFTSIKGSIYDREGEAIAHVSMNGGLLFFVAKAEDDFNDVKLSAFSLLTVPIVGVSLYNQSSVTQDAEKVLQRKEFLRLPIIGPCFATREGEDSGRPRFFWIPCGRKE